MLFSVVCSRSLEISSETESGCHSTFANHFSPAAPYIIVWDLNCDVRRNNVKWASKCRWRASWLWSLLTTKIISHFERNDKISTTHIRSIAITCHCADDLPFKSILYFMYFTLPFSVLSVKKDHLDNGLVSLTTKCEL